MAYLILSDFKKIIQSENLNQVIGNDMNVLTSGMQTAAAECISYLVQKYITAQEFQDTLPWSNTAVYKATNRVYLDAPAYNASAIYAIGDLTLQSGNVYRCNTTISVAEPFTAGHWTLIGAQYAMFYVGYPNPLFQLSTTYSVNDLVYWNDRSWKCLIATIGLSHEGALQSVYTQQIPPGNSFPDAPGQNQWEGKAPIPYVVPAGMLPTDTSYWTAGDNRNQQLVMYVIDITLYHIHKRIAPRNIPDLRVKAYDDAKKWLKDAAQGDYITADLPRIQPRSGARIRWGSNVRTQNVY